MKRKQLARIDLSDPSKPKVTFNSLEAFRSDLRDFKHDDRVWVMIDSYSPKRSLNQNNLAHVWYTMIAEEIGIEMEEAKELIKKKFLTVALTDKHGNEISDENGEVQFKVRDTRELTKAETVEYMDKIWRWALSFLNMTLPTPDEQVELTFKQ
jgi:hypothetical protein